MAGDHIFISYSHKDIEIVKKILQYFKDTSVRIWVDENGLPPTADSFNAEIEKAIKDCPFFIYVWTQNINESRYSTQEFTFAWEKNKKMFVLKCDKSLEYGEGMPEGLNILNAGNNCKEAYTDSMLGNTLHDIKEFIYTECALQNGLNGSEMIKALSEYYESSLSKFGDKPKYISEIIDESFNAVSIENIADTLISGGQIYLSGGRGTGKSTIAKAVFLTLLERMNNSIDCNNSVIHIPLFFDIESLWDVCDPRQGDEINVLCKLTNAPFSTDRNFDYIIVLDGCHKSKRGHLPNIINRIIDEDSINEDVLICFTEGIVVPSCFNCYSIKPLNFAQVVQYISTELSNARAIDFFCRLLKRTFDECRVSYIRKKDYFLIVKKIYEIFKSDSLPGGSGRSDEEGFYSSSLARTNQKGRLPLSFTNETHVAIWRKLVLENEAFVLLRNPYYLVSMVEEYQKNPRMLFPYKKSTADVILYRNLLDSVALGGAAHTIVCEKFLLLLAKLSKEYENDLVSLEELSKAYGDNTFARVKTQLSNAKLISVVDGYVSFYYDFVRDYLYERLLKGDFAEIEAKLKLANTSDVAKLFMSAIKTDRDEPTIIDYTYKDPLEMLLYVVTEERDDLSLMRSEQSNLNSVVKAKIESCKDAPGGMYKLESILRGWGRWSKDLSLIIQNQDVYMLKNSEFWMRINDPDLGEEIYISRFPITNSIFDEFILAGYQDRTNWEYGIDSIRLSDGSYRTSPIAPSSSSENDLHSFGIPNHPVIDITWYEAKAFCAWLSKKMKLSDKYTVRLPLKSEIEYLVKTNEPYNKPNNSINSVFFNGLSAIGVVDYFEESQIYDLIGNVWEWSDDGFSSDADKIQYCYGGAWDKETDYDHLWTSYPAFLSSSNLGFRVVVRKKL